MEIECTDGVKIKVSESDLYLKVTVGHKTWYWSKVDGSYDGTSFDWVDAPL